MAKMPYSQYCPEVCGAKCCKVYYDGTEEVLCECPKLSENRTCSIYKERFELGQPYGFKRLVAHRTGLKIVSVDCGTVKEILKNKQLPEWIEKQCCFAHPELLEVKNDKKLPQTSCKSRGMGQGASRVPCSIKG